jgi:hypothetical protein
MRDVALNTLIIGKYMHEHLYIDDLKPYSFSLKACLFLYSDGKTSRDNPYPILYLLKRDTRGTFATPRRQIVKHSSTCIQSQAKVWDSTKIQDLDSSVDSSVDSVVIPFATLSISSELLRKDVDVKFYTGLNNTIEFSKLFSFLQLKAQRMQYWKGESQNTRELLKRYVENPG